MQERSWGGSLAKRAASWQKRTMGKNKGKKASAVSCARSLSRALALARPGVRPSSLRPSSLRPSFPPLPSWTEGG